jgi:tetratricopeptide (TPR) repeat protein
MKQIQQLITQGDLNGAKGKLSQLTEIDSPLIEVQRRANFIDNCLERIQILQLDINYREKINKGNIAFQNKQYLEAKKYFLEALKLKPGDKYALMLLEKLDNLIAVADLFPTTQWTSFDLYEDQLLRIQYTGKRGSLDCSNQQGAPFYFGYKIDFLGSENLSLNYRKGRIKQYLIFTVDYKDCSNVIYSCTEYVDIYDIIDQYTNNLRSTDFNYPTDKIISKPYNIHLSNTKTRKCLPK